MKLTRGLASLALIVTSLFGQRPIHDKIVVTFSKPVMIGDTRLEQGEYTVRQLDSASNPRILEFSTDNGTKLQATVSAIPVLDNLNKHKTSAIVYDTTRGYQLHQLWIEGRDYGYEFVAPGGVKESEMAQSHRMTITATNTPAKQEVAQATPPPAPAPEPQPEVKQEVKAEPQPAPQPERQPEPQQQAQATPPPAPAPEPTPEPAAQQPTPTPAEQPAMPATATNWYTLVLAGFMLVGLGVALERYDRVKS